MGGDIYNKLNIKIAHFYSDLAKHTEIKNSPEVGICASVLENYVRASLSLQRHTNDKRSGEDRSGIRRSSSPIKSHKRTGDPLPLRQNCGHCISLR